MTDNLASVFEERAEYLSEEELLSWSALSPHDEEVISKLKGPGAKLLSGPRGSGKSTLLRTALYRLQNDETVLVAYVNFAKSLALEPLFHREANAIPLFRQWLFAKLVIGIGESVSLDGRSVLNGFDELLLASQALVAKLASGSQVVLPDEPLTASRFLQLVESWLDQLEKRRCVLLMDDAAHAFSPDQQREFFEVFREIRSRRVSCKAAVYPGITSYSPNFHVGHEAEVLEAWYRPEAEEYLPQMRVLVQKRLPQALLDRLSDRWEFVDYLALASFGLPRGFLNMLSELLGLEEDDSQRPSRRRAEQAVAEHAEAVRGIFRSLSGKLPRLKHFVEAGRDLELSLCRTLRNYNKMQSAFRRKTDVVAIEDPVPAEVERILNLLEYAGIVRKLGAVSRGVKGRFQRYCVHHSLVITENSLALGRSFSLDAVIVALQERDAHAFARARATSLIPSYKDRCKLNLPPCAKCGAARIAEEQHFCVKCGSSLTDVSIYEELLRAPIGELPLSKAKLRGIETHTTLRTVQDILLDDEAQALRRVPYIGPVWASRIRTYAEEFVSV